MTVPKLTEIPQVASKEHVLMAAAQFTACRNFACTKFFRLGQNHETISPTRIIMDMVCYAAPGGSDLQAMVLNAVLGPRITIT